MSIVNQQMPQNKMNKTPNTILDFNFAGPALVEASAGTGKTYTITGLVVRLLLGDYEATGAVKFKALPVEKMAIMTFTNAATADLKRKIRERIHQTRIDLLKGEGGDDLVVHLRQLFNTEEKLNAALLLLASAERDIDRASITTIHAFCGRLLRRYATGTSVAMNAESVDDEAPYRLQALVYAIRELTYNQELDEAFAPISLGLGSQALTQDGDVNGDDTRDVTCGEAYDDVNTDKEANTANACSFYRYLRTNKLIDASALVSDFSTYTADRVKKFKRAEINGKPAEYDSLVAMGKDFYIEGEAIKPRDGIEVIVNNTSKIEVVYKNIVKDCIYRRALEIFEELKNNLGVLTSDDYLFRLDYALKTNDTAGKTIAAEVRRQYPVMFIDEFQDTDPIQFDIVKRIYLDYFRVPHKKWREVIETSGIPSGFYIIGDPKQAIYSFRGADIDCYLAARSEIKEIGCELTSEFGCAENVYKLNTNYRSDGNLVQAVNYLFAHCANKVSLGGNNTEELENGITFEPVSFNEKRSGSAFSMAESMDSSIDTNKWRAFNFFALRGEKSKGLNKDKRNVLLAKHATKVVKALLENGKLNGKAITFKDLAVLVSNKIEASLIRKSLKAVGIPSVYGSERGVIQCSDEFKAVLTLMNACLNPRREAVIKLLVSSFFSISGEVLDKLLTGDDYDKLVSFLTECGLLWRQQGVMAMMVRFLFSQTIFGDRSVNDELLARAGGSQIFTNIMHAAEIAQAFSLNVPVPENQIPLMEELVGNSEGTRELLDTGIDPKLRLPSEENVIQVVTCHSSKGLEYPVVLMPFAGIHIYENTGTSFCYSYSSKNEAGEHEERCYDITIGEKKDNPAVAFFNEAEKEEGARLWYVAATRARNAMFVWMDREAPSVKNKKTIPSPFQLMFEEFQANENDASYASDIFNLKNIEADDCTFPEKFKPNREFLSLEVQVPSKNMIDSSWCIASYSRVTANRGMDVTIDIENEKLQHKEDITSDTASVNDVETNTITEDQGEVQTDAQTDASTKETSSKENALNDVSRFTFPRGAAAGTFLHDIFEHLSFKAGALDETALNDAVTERLKHTDFNAVGESWRPSKEEEQSSSPENQTSNNELGFEVLKAWVLDVLKTPLAGFTLADLEDKCCCKEMEFLFNMPSTIRCGGSSSLETDVVDANNNLDVDAKALVDTKLEAKTKTSNGQKPSIQDSLNGIVNKFYKEHDPEMLGLVKPYQVNFASLKGLMTGFIDLLVFHDGRFYVIDYKSNHLGGKTSDYNFLAMKQAVAEHRYDIQYIIYTVALQRFLKKVYGDKYSYDLIGGVRYLFLRGMAGETGDVGKTGENGSGEHNDGSTMEADDSGFYELPNAAYGVYGLRLAEALVNEIDAYFGDAE